jgi:hypothetical protein
VFPGRVARVRRAAEASAVLTWLVSVALAEPLPVVVVGDALVSGGPGAVPGGWVSVVSDCLDEAHPGGFSIVDRTRGGERPADLLGRLAELRPATGVVVVGFGFGGDAADARSVVDALTAPIGARVLLIAAVAERAERTDEVTAFNVALEGLLDAAGRVRMVDPGPVLDKGAGELWVRGQLTDAGHARLGALVCEALAPPAPPVPVAPDSE